MTNSRLPSGVVLDEPQARALLYTAIQENLLDGDPRIGDGFVGKLLNDSPSEGLINSSFEQLIIGGRVYVPFWMPSEWKGPLFERQLIVPMSYSLEDDSSEYPELPTQLILGMLHARNINWNENDLFDRYRRFNEAYTIWNENKGDKNYEWLSLRRTLANIIHEDDIGYTDEEIDRWEKLQDEYRELNPVQNVVKAYNRIISSSLQQGALSSIPISPAIKPSLQVGNVSDVEQRQMLFKVTCRELRRVPVGKNLSETIKLTNSSEAKALRLKLTEWTENLRHGNVNSIDKVLNEISRARNELSYSKALSAAGGYSTWAGFSTAAAAALINPEVSAAVGLFVTITGGLSLIGEKALKFRNRWAMFGED